MTGRYSLTAIPRNSYYRFLLIQQGDSLRGRRRRNTGEVRANIRQVSVRDDGWRICRHARKERVIRPTLSDIVHECGRRERIWSEPCASPALSHCAVAGIATDLHVRRLPLFSISCSSRRGSLSRESLKEH